MPSFEQSQLLSEIVSAFESVVQKLQHAAEAVADDASGAVDLAALRRAKDSAQRGAEIAREAMSQARRATG